MDDVIALVIERVMGLHAATVLLDMLTNAGVPYTLTVPQRRYLLYNRHRCVGCGNRYVHDTHPFQGYKLCTECRELRYMHHGLIAYREVFTRFKATREGLREIRATREWGRVYFELRDVSAKFEGKRRNESFT